MSLFSFRQLSVAAVAAFVSVSSIAGSTTDLSNSTVGKVSDGVASMPYRLFTPQDTQPDQKVPLILFLHGAGDRGSDNVGQTYWMKNLQARTKSGQYAAYVVAPQVDTNGWFASNGSATESMSLTMQVLKDAMQNPHVDTSRIYVTGISMGSYGTWDILRRMKNTFAAAAPMSGGGDTATAGEIGNTPVWAFHGSADDVVPVQTTRDMVTAVKKAGGNVKYTEVAGGDHFIWPAAYEDSSLYEWMFNQKLGSAATDEQVAVTPAVSADADAGSLVVSNSVVRRSMRAAKLAVTDQNGVSVSSNATVISSATAVPEPASLALLGMGCVALFARRRRTAC